ncbi:response regulator [Salinimicrobium catena]|uniref:response regulator n=1 Tax=Salinimicrobium catena TaxID=390640 RepID=UPI002FE4AD31
MEEPSSQEIEVLLIEDDLNDAEMICRTLSKNGWEKNLKHVEDGAVALELLRELKECGRAYPKLIILDLSMPKVNGSEVLEVIKTEETTRNIPVVVLTSSMEEKDLKRCYALGVNSYILKPVDYSEFSKTIKSLGQYWLQLNLIPN